MLKNNSKLVYKGKINLSPKNQILALKAQIEEIEEKIYYLGQKIMRKTFSNNDQVSLEDSNLLSELREQLELTREDLVAKQKQFGFDVE